MSNYAVINLETGPKLKRPTTDVAGDIRTLYLQEGNEVIFDTIGTHSQPYG